MIPVVNSLGHLNKRSVLMSGSLLYLHSLFQLLWWNYCSWEASLNSCTPVHLYLTSLILHHLKKSHKITLSMGRKTQRKGTIKTQMLNPNKPVDLLPFSQTQASASLRTWEPSKETPGLLYGDNYFKSYMNRGLKIFATWWKNVKNWIWSENQEARLSNNFE